MIPPMPDLPGEDALVRYAQREVREEKLRQFITSSNEIEGIFAETSPTELRAYDDLLKAKKIDLPLIQRFVAAVQPNAVLRDKKREKGKDIVIADRKTGVVIFRPPPSGPDIVKVLLEWLRMLNDQRTAWTPAEAHYIFESIHPFTDGNGRAGRALWLWQLERDGGNPLYGLPFLHRWYYESLTMARELEKEHARFWWRRDT